ncbi:MAG TPA: IS630 family transposase [Casimicrobium sp.]|nr:IS630 family transposase [Casimicrobium sp.]
MRAGEQRRPDVVVQRRQWCEQLACIDPRRLVFLDETGAKTNMTRLFARAPVGQRAVDYAPHGHWNTTTLVAAVTFERAIAPMVLDGPMDTLAFEAYVEQVLIPELPPGSIVVMDNLPAHKSASIARMLDAAGARLWYLPPYSPDFNPIEQMWSKVKSWLRRAKARTQEELYDAIAQALLAVSADDIEGFFRHCVVGIIN